MDDFSGAALDLSLDFCSLNSIVYLKVLEYNSGLWIRGYEFFQDKKVGYEIFQVRCKSNPFQH